MRPLVTLPLALLMLAAGCIAPPEAEDLEPAAAPPPPEDRIDGMTAQETKVDRKVDCGGSPGVCYERDLLVVGRVGLSELPVTLDANNGAITVTAGPGDAWSFHAVVRVRGPTDGDAREGLDTAWSWSHEENGAHALKAGPTPAAPVSLPLPLLPTASPATVMGVRYEVVLPAWIVLAVSAESSNGPIVLQADVKDVTAETSNGPIEAVLRPTASGALAFETSNGEVELVLVEDAAHGYDLHADTSNGRVTIELADGEVRKDGKTSASFRTRGYETRRVQTQVALETSNGAITVTG